MDPQAVPLVWGAQEQETPDRPRCPRCGTGDLLVTAVARREGGVWSGVYCAGLYDRERRKVLRRSCGYSGEGSEDGVSPIRRPVPPP